MESSTEGNTEDTQERPFDDDLGAIIGAVADIAIKLDSEGTVQAASDSVASTLGYDRGWLTGKSVTFLLAAETTHQFNYDVTTETELHTLLVDKERNDVTVPLEAADGTVVPMNISTLRPDEEDEIVCLARDISDRVRYKREHQQYKDLVQDVNDPMYVLDDDGAFEQVNDAMVEYTGYTRDELQGSSARMIIPPDEYEQATRELLEITEADDCNSTTLDVPVVSKDGEEILTEINVTVRTDDKDELAGSVGVLRDIRERKQRERELSEYRELVDTVGDPMYVLDADGYIERVNDAMVEYTGYDRDDLVGREMGEIVPATEYEQATQRLLELAQDDGQETDRFEITLVTKDGEMIQSEANVTVLTDNDGLY
jgi:PAS domain S-box-containing protein